MSQKTILLTVILFALIVVGMFMYARMRSTELSVQQAQLPAEQLLTVMTL